MRARGMGSARGGMGRGGESFRGESQDDLYINMGRDREAFRGSRGGRGGPRGPRGFERGMRGGRFPSDRPQTHMGGEREPREY